MYTKLTMFDLKTLEIISSRILRVSKSFVVPEALEILYFLEMHS